MPLKLNGSSSGYVQIEAPAVAGNNTLTLPTASGTLMTTGGSNTFTSNQIIEVTDNTNAALRITQLGTGAAIRVEDSTNPDSTPFVVDASGNVGIGTASPAYKLSFGAPANGTKSIALYETGAGNAFYGIGNDSDRMTFYTGNTSGGAERVAINNNGAFMVGTSGPGVGNSLGTSIEAGPSADAARITVNHSNSSSNGSYFMQFGYNGALIGNISQSSTSSVAYNTSSDYRLKEDIRPVANAAQRVMALKPVNFAWKVDGTRVDGFIAHEAQEVVPEAVTGEKDAVNEDGSIKPQGIDQSKLVPLLTAALQEALTKIDALETRIATLEAI